MAEIFFLRSLSKQKLESSFTDDGNKCLEKYKHLRKRSRLSAAQPTTFPCSKSLVSYLQPKNITEIEESSDAESVDSVTLLDL